MPPRLRGGYEQDRAGRLFSCGVLPSGRFRCGEVCNMSNTKRAHGT